jgi:predicted porin
MANNTLKAQYYDVDKTDKNTTDNSGTIWALGVDHSLSKTTLVYFAYASAENGKGSTGVNPSSSNGGHGTDGPVISKLGGDGTAYSFGTIMKF